jgi:exosortase/archaeosortase family protein
VPTDIADTSSFRKFAFLFAAWSLGLFGFLRLGWVESHAVLPITLAQGRLAARLSGTNTLAVDVTLACSGTDVLALCTGAILAYPVRWWTRSAGAAGGVVLILALNTLRITTLSRAAATTTWFEALHLYVWPAMLTLAVAGYVFCWMRVADGAVEAAPASGRRFASLAAIFLIVFIAASPLYLESAFVLAIAAVIARAAAVTLNVLGINATAAGHALLTARGGFLVTQECISTPLIPVYFAAVFAYSRTWRTGTLAVVAAAPLFVGLGIARLLVVAVPPAIIGSPVIVIHAFYQLVLAVVLVFLAGFWRHGGGFTAWRRVGVAIAVGAVVVYLMHSYMPPLRQASAAVTTFGDQQGAIALLPAFQAGLYVALLVAALAVLNWQPFVVGLTLLAVSQVAMFAALPFVVRYAGFAPHVRDFRAWAVAVPVLLAIAVVNYAQPRR